MKLLFALAAAFTLLQAISANRIVNCYYGTWANYRTGNGQFSPANIDPTLCTHISYSFFGIEDSGHIKSLDTWLDLESGLDNIRKTMALKAQNPNLKVLLVAGGWNEGSIKYSNMAADPTKRSNFVNSAMQWINQYSFDGFDLDWEYPAQRGGSAADRQNFVTLLQQLKSALGNKELGIAVGAGEGTASISYNIPQVAQHVDFINVMTYDFNMAGDGSGVVNFNAPLYGSGPNTVEASINFWLQQGAPASKLLLGIGAYGRTYTLANSQSTAPGSPATGPGNAGPYTKEAGYLGYNEICENLGSWSTAWDSARGVPYSFQSNQWVGYDNAQSIGLKMDFLKSKNLGGAMVWSIETDDFRGNCGAGRYPLLNAIKQGLGGTSTGTTPAPGTTTTRATTTTTRAPNTGGGSCGADGYYPNSSDCARFYQCVGGVRYDFSCGDGLYYDPSISTCNYKDQVQCHN